MKKRFSALLLALCLLLTVPAYAAQESGGFVRSKTYDGQFSDLSVGSVFYDSVRVHWGVTRRAGSTIRVSMAASSPRVMAASGR